MFGFEINRNQKLALIAFIGLCIIGLSVVHVRNHSRTDSGDVVLYEPGKDGTRVVATDPDSPYGAESSSKVVFQVAGYVERPGLYSLPKGKRVMDAIMEAGGPKQNADMQAINIAEKIQDGVRIYVPSHEETKSGSGGRVFTEPKSASATKSGAKSSPGADKLKSPGEGTVNINTADVNELQRLPGVGPATAAKILEYRGQIGKFSNAEQLVDVKGIGPKTFEKMRPFISL